MNNILRLIAEYQQSDYSTLQRALYIRKYLKSFDYISEFQRFLEDQNYKVIFKTRVFLYAGFVRSLIYSPVQNSRHIKTL